MASEKATADKKVRRSGGLGNAFRGTVAELKKVQWPTKKQVIKYTGVVIVFCAICYCHWFGRCFNYFYFGNAF